MGEIIVVTSLKGGVGKTTTTVNLGASLAMNGKRVLLIDADPQGSLTASLGYQEPDDIRYTLATINGYRYGTLPIVPCEEKGVAL